MRMFAAEQRGVVFLENVINLRRRRHTIIEVIPMPRDLALDAPAYFKVRGWGVVMVVSCEGILGSESEWSQHKKLIDTVARGGFRRSMVKEMPYFHVWFGPDGGYGHVIEDEGEWDERFGKVSPTGTRGDVGRAGLDRTLIYFLASLRRDVGNRRRYARPGSWDVAEAEEAGFSKRSAEEGGEFAQE
ncbi:hypothetical protein BC937DRAFT_90041 [Endogone sp. FLAS-F59071]|nr:hypothetical protein BC937DRAFT_90041 [Endogone sp. FLAS-F59071]|eukprot:RUS17389.1 hypothetical protein BC937DRAFT_90041 [Endogone sp. FLAS-F59071]